MSHILVNSIYWRTAHALASRSRTAWLCSCGLQDGYDVSRLFRILPDARVIIGVPERDDTARDLERSRNAVRFQQRIWPKIQFREHPLVHYKFHIFFTHDNARVAFVGSMNMTANRWDEMMVEVAMETVEELCEIFERVWKTSKEVKPHKATLLKDLEVRVVKGRFDVEK